MPCLEGKDIIVCVPTVDAWRRVFARCPVCRTRRLVLGEFQDYYGERFTCLTCGTGWMDGEYRKVRKREKVEVVTRAKQRVKEYVAAGVEQGFGHYMERLATSNGNQPKEQL